jgi:hypothetical protein
MTSREWRLGHTQALRPGLPSPGAEAVAGGQGTVAPAGRNRPGGRDFRKVRWRNMDGGKLFVLLGQFGEAVVGKQEGAACKQEHLKSKPDGEQEKGQQDDRAPAGEDRGQHYPRDEQNGSQRRLFDFFLYKRHRCSPGLTRLCPPIDDLLCDWSSDRRFMRCSGRTRFTWHWHPIGSRGTGARGVRPVDGLVRNGAAQRASPRTAAYYLPSAGNGMCERLSCRCTRTE